MILQLESRRAKLRGLIPRMSEETERMILQLEIDEILIRAYNWDDKPHQLFSGIRALALRHPSALTGEIVRQMDAAYSQCPGNPLSLVSTAIAAKKERNK